jgi:peptidoglycan/LPS O-acetylase OafA/YrhL
MQRGYVVSMTGGVVLLATSFANLFDAEGQGLGTATGCSAWSACPGFMDGYRPNALLPWLVGIGVLVAFASPVIKRSWWPVLYAGVGVAAVVFIALLMTAGGPYTDNEWNSTASAPPSPWLALMVAALVAIGVGPRQLPAPDDD